MRLTYYSNMRSKRAIVSSLFLLQQFLFKTEEELRRNSSSFDRAKRRYMATLHQ